MAKHRKNEESPEEVEDALREEADGGEPGPEDGGGEAPPAGEARKRQRSKEAELMSAYFTTRRLIKDETERKKKLEERLSKSTATLERLTAEYKSLKAKVDLDTPF